MGDQGRSSANNCAAMVMLALLMSMVVAVQASSHIVGTSTNEWQVPGQGNSLNSTYYEDWANSQSFAAGDILIFTYTSAHDVLQVTSTNYASCSTSSPIKTYNSGNDSIAIAAGTTYFICGTPTHCSGGQKVSITTTNSTSTNSTTASPPPPPSPPPPSGSAAFRHGTTYTPPAFAAIVFAFLSALAS